LTDRLVDVSSASIIYLNWRLEETTSRSWEGEKLSNMSQTKYPYIVTAIGVGLMAIGEVYSFVRAMMFRAMFRPGGGSPGFVGGRQFGGGFGFGLPGILTMLALIIAIVGVVWLGLSLRNTTGTK